MLSFSERDGWSFIKLTWKVQSRPILELKHSRVRMITDFRFNLFIRPARGRDLDERSDDFCLWIELECRKIQNLASTLQAWEVV